MSLSLIESSTPQASRLKSSNLAPASLENPLYYLGNLQTVVRWILEHHADLLVSEEVAALQTLLTLPLATQALLVRMIMRKGEYFRRDGLRYEEVPDIDGALAELVAARLVEKDPALSATTLFQLCRAAELRQLLLSRGVAIDKGFRKSEALEPLAEIETEEGARPLSRWWPQAPLAVIALGCQPLFDRVRLMFFGNLYQDWSEFVLTELGLQRYEIVDFGGASRAFQTRLEVDDYLALAAAQQVLEEGGEVHQALDLLPPASANSWLAYRRDKVLFTLAREAERGGNSVLALSLYEDNKREEALVRKLRLLEKTAPTQQVLEALAQARHGSRQPLTDKLLQRIEDRAARKQGKKTSPLTPFSVLEQTVELQPVPAERVEQVAAGFLQREEGVCVFYTENALFPGLLGLLCWPVLFEPLPGAFFHPFQAGPADLFRPDFVTRREEALRLRLATLDDGSYRQLIKNTWRDKYGIACSLVNWSALSQQLLDCALELIPAAHLRRIFTHLLADLRQHRRGMPDLTVFNPGNGTYQLVEVKGPGDRLQDHQALWLEALQRMGVDVAVLHVRFADPA